jgi:hypothetical protein
MAIYRGIRTDGLFVRETKKFMLANTYHFAGKIENKHAQFVWTTDDLVLSLQIEN